MGAYQRCMGQIYIHETVSKIYALQLCLLFVLVEYRIGSLTRVLVVQIQRFSESLEGARSDDMLKSQIWNGP